MNISKMVVGLLVTGVLVAVSLPASASFVETFDTYSVGNLVAQSNWQHLNNWYGNDTQPDGTVEVGGINNQKVAALNAAIRTIDPNVIQPNGDVTVTALIRPRTSTEVIRLLLGNEGLADGVTPLHGNRIFFNPGGDATYQDGESGDTGNPKITGIDFVPNSWVQVKLEVSANDNSLGTLGTLKVSWRDVDNVTGVPLGAGVYTVLGTIPQTYGTPAYFGFVITGRALLDNVEGVGDIPEPATLALLGLGGLMMLRRRRTA